MNPPPRIFMNGLKCTLIEKEKCYRYISCITFLPVRYFELFVIHQFGELDLLKPTKE